MRKQTIQYISLLDALVTVAKRLSLYENQQHMDSETFFDQFTTGHFFQSLNCNIESHRNRVVFTQQVIKQSQSELEQTEITAIAPMDNTNPPVLLT